MNKGGNPSDVEIERYMNVAFKEAEKALHEVMVRVAS